MDESMKHVETLIKKAAETEQPMQAMQLAQAAHNAANALCTLQHVKSQQSK